MNDPRAVILVEGTSDEIAIQALAKRLGHDLEMEGVAVVPMGGATNIAHFLAIYGPRGLNLQLAGLCDAAEEDAFRHGLRRLDLGSVIDRDAMEQLGFYVCVKDLEDELIRCLGADAVERVIDAQGESSRFQAFQRQPAWRGQIKHDQLWRFVRSHSVRNSDGPPRHYARLLIDALDLEHLPRPLELVLAHIPRLGEAGRQTASVT